MPVQHLNPWSRRSWEVPRGCSVLTTLTSRGNIKANLLDNSTPSLPSMIVSSCLFLQTLTYPDSGCRSHSCPYCTTSEILKRNCSIYLLPTPPLICLGGREDASARTLAPRSTSESSKCKLGLGTSLMLIRLTCSSIVSSCSCTLWISCSINCLAVSAMVISSILKQKAHIFTVTLIDFFFWIAGKS